MAEIYSGEFIWHKQAYSTGLISLKSEVRFEIEKPRDFGLDPFGAKFVWQPFIVRAEQFHLWRVVIRDDDGVLFHSDVPLQAPE